MDEKIKNDEKTDRSNFLFSAQQVAFADNKDTKKDRFAIVGYDGGIFKHPFWGNTAFDLTGISFAKQKTPCLAEHFTSQRIGFCDKQEIADTIFFEGKFCKNDDAQKLRSDMEDGFPMEASLSLEPSVLEYVEDGESVSVNGKQLEGPGTVFRKAQIKEISMCVFGACPNTESKAFAEVGKAEFNYVILRKDKSMEKVKMTLAEFSAQNPELFAEITAKANADGQKTVRDQFAAMSALFEGDAAFAVEQFAKGASLEEAKTAYIAQLKAAKPAAAPAAAKVDAAAAEFSDTQAPAAPAKKTGIEAWKAEFAASQELQDEFSDEKSYLAFKSAEAKGLIKVAKK